MVKQGKAMLPFTISDLQKSFFTNLLGFQQKGKKCLGTLSCFGFSIAKVSIRKGYRLIEKTLRFPSTFTNWAPILLSKSEEWTLL